MCEYVVKQLQPIEQCWIIPSDRYFCFHYYCCSPILFSFWIMMVIWDSLAFFIISLQFATLLHWCATLTKAQKVRSSMVLNIKLKLERPSSDITFKCHYIAKWQNSMRILQNETCLRTANKSMGQANKKHIIFWCVKQFSISRRILCVELLCILRSWLEQSNKTMANVWEKFVQSLWTFY